MSKTSTKKGFTLVEIMVALFVFIIIMAAVSQIFVAAFSGYRNGRTVQKDLQNAQFTLNSMAKMLRTSTVVSNEDPDGSDRIKFYDYSQERCIEYIIDSSNQTLSIANVVTEDPEQCEDQVTFSSADFVPLTSGNVSGKFIITPSSGSSPKRVGRVTVSLEIKEGDTHRARIQSSTSLRDYGNVGW